MLALRSALAVLRFVLELCLIAAYGYFGFTFPDAAGWILGLGLPAVLIAVWGALVAPRSPRRLPDTPRFALETVLFALGMGALAAVGFWPWGVALFVVFILDLVSLERLGKPDWAAPPAP